MRGEPWRTQGARACGNKPLFPLPTFPLPFSLLALAVALFTNRTQFTKLKAIRGAGRVGALRRIGSGGRVEYIAARSLGFCVI